MAYSDDIAALGAQHHWTFDASSLDVIGSSNGVNTSISNGPALSEDATNSARTTSTEGRVTVPSTADINNLQSTRKAVCGWFMTSAIQTPPNRIYGEGNQTTSFAFIMSLGNNVMLEVDSASFTLQVYADRPLRPNRAYHLCAVFEGSGFGNELRFYLDGVQQFDAEPQNRQPNAANLSARTSPEFGDPAGTVGVGGDVVVLVAPVNGHWQHWASFDGASAQLTDSEVRQELFEKGALPGVTIASGSQASMQTALDALADTARPDEPLCIRVEAVSGNGALTLIADNVTFDALASIHVQYMGVGQLTWVNTGGGDASIGSTPNGGTVVFQTEVTLTVTVLDASGLVPIEGARVFVEAAAGGPLPEGDTILNALTNASGVVSTTFNYQSNQPIRGRSRKTSPFYKTGSIVSAISAEGADLSSILIRDE